jgi:hypothetical protein
MGTEVLVQVNSYTVQVFITALLVVLLGPNLAREWKTKSLFPSAIGVTGAGCINDTCTFMQSITLELSLLARKMNKDSDMQSHIVLPICCVSYLMLNNKSTQETEKNQKAPS